MYKIEHNDESTSIEIQNENVVAVCFSLAQVIADVAKKNAADATELIVGVCEYLKTEVKAELKAAERKGQFDWAAFTAGDFEVLVNEDNVEEFLEECGKNGLSFTCKTFNPLDKEYRSVRKFARMFSGNNLCNEDETFISVNQGALQHGVKVPEHYIKW